MKESSQGQAPKRAAPGERFLTKRTLKRVQEGCTRRGLFLRPYRARFLAPIDPGAPLRLPLAIFCRPFQGKGDPET